MPYHSAPINTIFFTTGYNAGYNGEFARCRALQNFHAPHRFHLRQFAGLALISYLRTVVLIFRQRCDNASGFNEIVTVTTSPPPLLFAVILEGGKIGAVKFGLAQWPPDPVWSRQLHVNEAALCYEKRNELLGVSQKTPHCASGYLPWSFLAGTRLTPSRCAWD